MTEREIPVTEDELHAYVDNELPAERRRTVETWLAAHPEDAERVRAWQAIGEQVRDRFGSVADEPVPQRLELERLIARPRRWIGAAIAASLTAFMLGNGTGWMAHTVWSTETSVAAINDELRDDALVAHKLYTRESRHPIEVSGTEEHLLPWLSRQMGTTLRAPDLTQFGLKLLGGRLLPGPNAAPAALFMYENQAGIRVTLYCAPTKGPTTAMVYKESEGMATVLWTHDDFAWVMSGPPNKEKMKIVAAAAYAQLE
jgi:anti-sigma factor RsiW